MTVTENRNQIECDQTVASLSTQLLDAHVHHIKKQLLTEAEDLSAVASVVDQIVDWLKTVPLKRAVDREMILQSIDNLLIHFPYEQEAVAKERRDWCSSLMKYLLNADAHQHYSLGDLVDDEAYRLGVEKAVDLQRLRSDLIDALLSSSVYADLISDILYNGIKDFILEENLLAKLPGVSSLLKMGKWGMSRTLPNLDAFIEGAAKTFIVANIPKMVSLSKRFLDKTLTPDNIRRFATDCWDRVAEHPMSNGGGYITEQDIEDLVRLFESQWLFYRKSDHFKQLCGEGIDYIVSTFGDRTIGDIYLSLGGDQALLASEIKRYLSQWAQIADTSGFLESLIRSQLASFYQSEACQLLLISAE